LALGVMHKAKEVYYELITRLNGVAPAECLSQWL